MMDYRQLESWRTGYGGRLVVTNGCFDILHAGHVELLREARALGHFLLVGLNDDEGIRRLKGPSRPVNPAEARAVVLAAIRWVDGVVVFPGERATEFLRRAKPDIYVKGGDYTLQSLYPPEREVLMGAEIHFVPLRPGFSTTGILQR